MAPKKTDVITSIGRRKSAIARIKFHTKPVEKLSIVINGRDFKDYFNYFEWQDVVTGPLKLVGKTAADIAVRIDGGGIPAQAEAVRLGIARALINLDKELRPTLKRAGFLTRDSRIKERKKPGLKRARRAPQWSKR